MPNYGLVVSPTFTPMTYELYAKPFLDYAKVYFDAMDKYDDLTEKAGVWEKLKYSDPEAYKLYLNYLAGVVQARNDLSTYGLNPNVRNNISDLRTSYNQQIVPISEAYDHIQKLAEEQRQKNPKGDIQWSTDFSKVKVSQVLKNPTMSYEGRSLSDIEKEAFDLAVALSGRMLTESSKSLANLYFYLRKGFDAEYANNWLARQKSINPEAAKDAEKYIDDILVLLEQTYNLFSSNSIYSYEQDADAQNRLLNGIMKGLSYQENYQHDSWSTPAAAEYTDRKKEDGKEVPIGYEIKMKDGTRYVKTNEGGLIKYYKIDENNIASTTPTALSEEELKNRDTNYDEKRYILRSISDKNSASSKYIIYDTWNHTPLRNSNKYQIVYDPDEDYFDPLTRTVTKIQKNSSSTTTKEEVPVSPYITQYVVSNSKNSVRESNSPGYIRTKHTNTSQRRAQIASLVANEGFKEVTYNLLSPELRSAIGDETVHKNPNRYLYYIGTDDADGIGTGDNEVVYVVPVNKNSVSIQGNAQTDEEFNNNELK